MAQAFNPYLPSWEYVPDGEPYVFGDRLYIFGSHDEFNGKNFCPNDYVCWSAPTDDLSDWKCHGVIYRTRQDPDAKESSFMQAPDVIQGPDGRYYLYYTLSLAPFMSVAVSDNLTGPYEYYGKVHLPNGHVLGSEKHEVFQFDPGLFKDDDGKYYLYTGFAPADNGIMGIFTKIYRMEGAYVMELGEDMLTAKAEPKLMIPKTGHSKGTGFEGHEFYEASSLRKINGKYYFIYSSILSHELCYAVSDRPDEGFVFGGTLVSIGDIGFCGNKKAKNYLGNTHGSLVCVNGQWYVFYHRQTNGHMYSRQGCAEPVTIAQDGSIAQVEVTSCGLNNAPLSGKGRYSAHITCNLMGKKGAYMYSQLPHPGAKKHPYLTQTGADRECDPDQYIANMRDGSSAGFKYFSIDSLGCIAVEAGGIGKGKILIRCEENGEVLCSIPVCTKGEKAWFEAPANIPKGVHSLFFSYSGKGYIDLHSFELK